LPDPKPTTRRMPLDASPPGVDDVSFLQAEDDEVKVRLQILPDGSLSILALAPNTRLAELLLENVPEEQIRTELCG
jgi:hypothetical protein